MVPKKYSNYGEKSHKIYKCLSLELVMEKITVADVMTRDPVVIDPEENLFECARKMVKKKVGSLVLVKDKKITGFLSQKDILWALVKKSKKDLEDIKAKDIAAKKVTTIRPEADIRDAVKKMENKKFDRLPVIENGRKLVGIVTVKDILNFSPEIYPELEEYAQIREEQEKLNRIKKLKSKDVREGICEECGERDFLQRFNGMLTCESCRSVI